MKAQASICRIEEHWYQVYMTLIEMLDAVEAEVTRLRSERAKLAAALDTAQEQLRALLTEPGPANSAPKREKAPEAKSRPPRKRQALGKTLAQLRSAARREII